MEKELFYLEAKVDMLSDTIDKIIDVLSVKTPHDIDALQSWIADVNNMLIQYRSEKEAESIQDWDDWRQEA